MKLLMRDEAKGREHTIFVTIFSALMVMPVSYTHLTLPTKRIV